MNFMEIEEILTQNESQTIEFKESAQSLSGILRTVIAFANTAGGLIVIGVEDKTKKIMGIPNPLSEEERLASTIADSIAPLIVPDIEIRTYRDKEIILISVPHMAGPYYLKSAGPDQGVIIRFGSTNRVADATTLKSLRLFAQNLAFDELHYLFKEAELDWEVINTAFDQIQKKVDRQKAQILGLLTQHSHKTYPTNGGIILFGKDRERIFPDPMIRCARFLGTSKVNALDQIDIRSYPIFAIEEAIRFVERNTSIRAEIGRVYRTDIPEYPPVAIREAIINAVVHADYSLRATSIKIHIFDDRIEITNPGGLMFGQTMHKVLTGSSILRNHVIGRIFRELKLIEHWGSGIKKIIDSCKQRGLKSPEFEDRHNEFRVTLFSTPHGKMTLDKNQKELLSYARKKRRISTKDAARLWDIDPRNARTKIKQLVALGFLKRIGTSAKDPKSSYILTQDINLDE